MNFEQMKQNAMLNEAIAHRNSVKKNAELTALYNRRDRMIDAINMVEKFFNSVYQGATSDNRYEVIHDAFLEVYDAIYDSTEEYINNEYFSDGFDTDSVK